MLKHNRNDRYVLVPPSLVVLLFSIFGALDLRAQGIYVEANVIKKTGSARLISKSRPGNYAFAPKYKLEPGNEIITEDNGRVEISLTDGSQVIVLPSSHVRLNEFRYVNSARELLDILVGRVHVTIRHPGNTPNPYRLSSPAASIAVRGTDFIVDVSASGETSVIVYEGLVEVSSLINPENKRLVSPGDRVIVRPGGDISMSFPGPGGELNGKSRGWKDVGQIYQQSVNSLVQNSTDISPTVFSAFSDPHLDSLENPAYAAEFNIAQGRISVMPSVRPTDSLVWKQVLLPVESEYQTGEPSAYFDYYLAPQLTFFTPLPGTRLSIGGGISAVRSNLSDLQRFESSYITYDMHGLPETGVEVFYSDTQFHIARLNLSNLSMVAAYSLGADRKTSIGIGIDHMSGKGSLQFDIHKIRGESSFDNVIYTKTRLTRTRISFGFAHEFSGGRKLGLFIRKGHSSSNQKYEQRLNAVNWPTPIDSYVLPVDKIFDYSKSSEIGIRWRAPLSRRIIYGVESSFLHEHIRSRGSLLNQPAPGESGGAWRGRLGGGLGFALRRTTVINFDLAGGYYKTAKPQIDLGQLFIPAYYLIPRIEVESSERGRFLSAHAGMQTKLWKNLFGSASHLMTIHKNYFNSAADPYDRKVSRFTTLGAGWKFKPNLVAQYLISFDHSPSTRIVPSHSLMLRYTFDLKITNEK
jgi:FecR protein